MNYKNEDEVYVIGKNSLISKKRGKGLIICLIGGGILFITMLSLIYSYSQDVSRINTETQELQSVNVLPANAKAPLFMGKYDMKEFISWLSKQIKYPEGHELEEAKVIVSFIITEKGILDSISIISQPEEKIFGEQVIKILQSCPKWESGKLDDGTPTSIRYILPINFKRQRTFN